MLGVNSLPALAPIFLVFEVWQLVIGERYLGIKQIARGADPRTLGLRETTAFFWSMCLLGYWAWMLLLLFTSTGRVYGVVLLCVSLLGFTLRRGAPLKWVLMIMSFEGAIRVGFLFSLTALAWWRHH